MPGKEKAKRDLAHPDDIRNHKDAQGGFVDGFYFYESHNVCDSEIICYACVLCIAAILVLKDLGAKELPQLKGEGCSQREHLTQYLQDHQERLTLIQVD